MGEDKALLPFAGFDTLTEFQYTRLSKIFTHLYISCKDKNKFSFPANYIEDKKGADVYAPTLAFISIFETLSSDSFFAISVDSPFIDETIITKLVEQNGENVAATVALTDGKLQPLCGIYHHSLLPAFYTMLQENNHKLNNLLKNSRIDTVTFKDDNRFLNLNHPDEYKKALQLI